MYLKVSSKLASLNVLVVDLIVMSKNDWHTLYY